MADAVVPGDLAKLVKKARKRIDDRCAYALYPYELSEKKKLKLVELGDPKQEVEAPGWLAFARLAGESEVLCVAVEKPHAVGVWDGSEMWTYRDSFSEFVARLVDKHDKTPFDKLDKTLDAIEKLVEANGYGDALGMLEQIIVELPASPYDDECQQRTYKLYGLALKGVHQLDNASAAFERAAAAGDSHAILDLLAMQEEAGDPAAVIDHGVRARDERYFNTHGKIWIARYLAAAYARNGELAKGEAELREIVEEYAISAGDKIDETRESLAKLGIAEVEPWLAWFKAKSYDVTPEEAVRNRAWWDALPEAMRTKLLEDVGLDEDKSPITDADIARCQDCDSLDLDEDDGTFDTLDAFLPLARLTSLNFHGDPENLEPLRALPKLESLSVDNNLIKDFALPPRVDRDLWKAAEKFDKAGMEKALAAGANIHARSFDYGKSALHFVADGHKKELALWLIGKGADPWAGSHDDGSWLGYWDDEKPFVDAALRAGIRHPDEDPYRVLERQREKAHATFQADKLELELEDGEPLADKWPADARFAMETPKKDNKLYDLHRVAYRGLVASERLADVLRGEGVEVLPVTLLDHAKKPIAAKYFFVNPLAVKCLDLAKCYPSWNYDGESISELAAVAIDPAKVAGRQMFRIQELSSHDVVITRELAAKLAGFTGVRVEYAKR